jgi:hypothetical protein
MPKSCIICRAIASPDLQLQYCAQCQSALYCSKVCQRKDWKNQHKKICKFLVVGHGDMQVRIDMHTRRRNMMKEGFERDEHDFDEDDKQFFKLFTESTFEGSQTAARKMKKIAKRCTKHNQKFLLFHSLKVLIRYSNLEMLSWPNSPLLVMLELLNPNVRYGYDDAVPLDEGETRETPLHMLADLLDPCDYSVHERQLILAKQLIERGANVNAVSNPEGKMPLHNACYGCNVTNLDFVEYLLKEGADPNAAELRRGLTPLILTVPDAPGAAKFLLNWPSTDVNIATRSGKSFPACVRQAIIYFSGQIALPANPERVQHQFKLQQWSVIEEMLVERGALDTSITTIE